MQRMSESRVQQEFNVAVGEGVSSGSGPLSGCQNGLRVRGEGEGDA